MSKPEDEDPSKWLQPIRDKLFSMFCSPMKEDYTHEAFKWVSHLCISFGDLSWISIDGKWTQNEVKIFSCIVRLSINEVQILLPVIQSTLISCDDAECIRLADSSDYDKFGDHLVILESAIKSLVKGQTDDRINNLADSIKGEDMKIFLERLKEALMLISEYLELVYNNWDELIKDSTSEKFSSAEAGLRIMCVWLSEDPCGFEIQCERFLIDLIIKHLLMNGSSKNDLLVLALHAVCTGTDKLQAKLKDCPNHRQALESYLKYVQQEGKSSAGDRRADKVFKLRCGLIKDLMSN